MSAPPKARPSRIAVEENGVRYFADLTGGPEDRLVLRPARQPRLHGGARQGATRCSMPIATPAASASPRRKRVRRKSSCLDCSAPALALAEESAAANGVVVQVRQGRRVRGTGASGRREGDLRHRHRRSAAFRDARARIWSPARRPIASWRGWRRLSSRRTDFSCSHPARTISAWSASPPNAPPASRAADRSAALIRQAGAGPDHPVHPMLPETAYLKALVYALD